MRFFAKCSQVQFPKEEEATRRKERLGVILEEIQKNNFEKAIELALKCVEKFREKDSLGEAQSNSLVAKAMIGQYLDKTKHKHARAQKCMRIWPKHSTIRNVC